MSGYGSPTIGLSGFESGPNQNYRAPNATVCPGSSGFSVLLAFELKTLTSVDYSSVGNIDTIGTTGWQQTRSADEGDGALIVLGFDVNTSGGVVSVELPHVPAAMIVGRTVLLGLTVSDSDAQIAAYLNGGAVGVSAYADPADTYTPAAGPARFSFGNATQNSLLGSQDRMLSFAYLNSVLSPLQMVQMWRRFRETSNLRLAQDVLNGLLWSWSYEVFDISAPPRATIPLTLPNGGTVASSDLVWAGSPNDSLPFTVDSDPDFAVSLAPEFG